MTAAVRSLMMDGGCQVRPNGWLLDAPDIWVPGEDIFVLWVDIQFLLWPWFFHEALTRYPRIMGLAVRFISSTVPQVSLVIAVRFSIRGELSE